MKFQEDGGEEDEDDEDDEYDDNVDADADEDDDNDNDDRPAVLLALLNPRRGSRLKRNSH